MKALKVIMIVLLVAIFFTGTYLLYNKLSSTVEMDALATQPAGTEPGSTEPAKSPALDFTMYDFEGNSYQLSDFQGKPVVLNFWASWCGPCKMEMPEFQAKFEQYGEDVHFLMVNLTDGKRETVEGAHQFIEDAGYTFPVYYDKDMDAAAAYGINSVPVTYFVDSDGNMVAYGRGALTGESLQNGIDMILSR